MKTRFHFLLTLLFMAATARAAVGDVMASGTCGANVTWTLTENSEKVTTEGYNGLTLTVTGTGAMSMSDTSYGSQIFEGLISKALISEVIIGEGITSINLFSAYESLRRISLPTTLTTIPSAAFSNCRSLKSIVIPDGVTLIQQGTFMGCDSLRSVTIGSGVTQIRGKAFKNCAQLMTVRFKRYVPDNGITMCSGYATSVSEDDSFYGCADLVSIVVPEGAFEAYNHYYRITNWYTFESNYEKPEDVPGYSRQFVEKHITVFPTRTDRDTLFAVGSTNEWRTWCDNVSHAAPKGAEVYAVNCVEDRMVKLNKITATVTLPEDEREGAGDDGVRAFIPAFTPVLIKRASGEVTKPIVAPFVMGGEITVENGWTRIEESHTSTSGGKFDADYLNATGDLALDKMPYGYNLVTYQPVFFNSLLYSKGIVKGSAGPNKNFICGNVCQYDPSEINHSRTNSFALKDDEFKRFTDNVIPLHQFILEIRAGDLGSDTESPVPLKVFNELALADNGDNTDAIATAVTNGGTCDRLTLSGRTLYKDGFWNTLCLPFDLDDFTGTPLEGATVKTLGSSSFSNGTLNLNFTDNLSAIEAGKPYLVKWSGLVCLTINNDDDWNTFVAAVAGGNSFAGNTVLLNADINVSTMVGSENRPFRGTFDGNGHTLNVSINQTDADFAAPFRYISNATIRNLKVTGSVNGGPYCAGIVGAAMGETNSIGDCWMNANVTGQGYIGGVLGHGTTSATTLSNCYMTSTLSGYGIGVFCGWGNSGGTHTINNCWSMGDYNYPANGGGINLIQTDGGTININNGCHNSDAISQGEKQFIIVFGGGTTYNAIMAGYLGSQWAVDGSDNLMLKPSSVEFTFASEIVNPLFKNVAISDVSVPVETGCVDFIGNTSPVNFTANDHTMLFLGAQNTLYYPSAAMTVGSCRAYFKLKGITAGAPTQGGENSVKEFVLNFGGEDDPDGIQPPYISPEGERTGARGGLMGAGWYDLSGRKLDGKPTQKGIYINNGRKVTVD